MTFAADFRAAFLAAYQQARERYGPAEWEEMWTDPKAWSKVMIYNEDAVVRVVAPRLNLQCWPGEPLHLDAIFFERDADYWLPIHIAIEHENAASGFREEIQKLLSIRCPLKVGITYGLTSDSGSLSDLRARTEDKIRQEIFAVNAVMQEDLRTEYLFLIGCEIKRFELQWFSLIFNAASGPGSQAFQ